LAERKIATVLFADIVNSTRIVSALDAEDALTRLRPLVNAMTSAVKAQGGTVVQIQGDGVLACFGAIDGSEDHVLDACRAALQIRAAAHQTASSGLEARIGVHTGEVIVSWIRDGTSLLPGLAGGNVHLASRLEQAAEPNTILISAEAFRSIRPIAEARPRGRLTFKGFVEPVETWELLHLQGRSRWAVRATLGLSPFLGRDAALTAVRDVLKRVREGRGGAVIVRGDPGTGKSRLVHEALVPEEVGDCSLWEADTEPPARHSPYAAVRELIRQWLGLKGEAGLGEAGDRLAAAVRQYENTLASFNAPLRALLNLDTKGTGWEDLEPPHRREQMVQAFRAVCRLQADIRPLMIVVEDLQWCDEESLQLLGTVAREVASIPLAMMLTTRPVDMVHLSEFFPDAVQVELEEFSPAEAEAFVDALLGSHESLIAIKKVLADVSGGLPLFLEEAVHHLVDQGVLTGNPGRYRSAGEHVRIETPRSVHAVATSRIGRLSRQIRATVLAASVIGRRFPLAILTSITQLPQETMDVHIAELTRQHILFVDEADGSAEFRHEFIREAAYSTLLRDTRRELHARTVRAGERMFDNRLTDWLGFLSHHAAAAELYDDAVRYTRLAAEQAVESSSYRAALQYCERALDYMAALPPTRENRVAAIDIRLLLRVAVGSTSDFEPWLRHLGEAMAIAEEIGDAPRRLLASVHRTWALNFAGSGSDAVRSGEMALSLAQALRIPQSEALARIALGQAAHVHGDYRKAAEVLGPAINWLADGHTAERIGTTGTTYVLCLMLRANALGSMGRFGEAQADLAAMAEVVTQTGRVYDEVSLCWGRGLWMVYRGDFAAALPVLQRGYDLCCRSENNLFLPVIAWMLGSSLITAGKVDDADLVLSHALRAAELVGHGVARIATTSTLAAVRLAQGRADEGLSLAGEARTLAHERNHHGVEVSATRVLAQCFAALDSTDVDRPALLLQQATDLACEVEATPSALSCLSLLVPLLVKSGRLGEAHECCHRAIQIAQSANWLEAVRRFELLLKTFEATNQ
jgi:class 3 adenylate cyclase/tetratricopeptide (TPR) repeat protein